MKFTVYEISDYLFVTPETVRRWVKEGKLECVKQANKNGLLIDSDDLLRFLDKMPKYNKVFNNRAGNFNSIKLLRVKAIEEQIEIKKKEILELEKAIMEVLDSE